MLRYEIQRIMTKLLINSGFFFLAMYGIFEECGALWQMNLHLNTLIKIKRKKTTTNVFDQDARNYACKHKIYTFHKPTFHTNIKILILPSKNILSLSEPMA